MAKFTNITDYVNSHFESNKALSQKELIEAYLKSRKKTGLSFSEYEEKLFKIFTMTVWNQTDYTKDAALYRVATVAEARHELANFATSGSSTKKADEYKAIKSADASKSAVKGTGTVSSRKSSKHPSKVFEIFQAKDYLPKGTFVDSAAQYYALCKQLGEIRESSDEKFNMTTEKAPVMNISRADNAQMVLVSLLDYFDAKADEQIKKQSLRPFISNLATMITLKAINLDGNEELDKIYDKMIPYFTKATEDSEMNIFDLRDIAVAYAQERITELNKAAQKLGISEYPNNLQFFFDDVLQENQIEAIVDNVNELHCSYAQRGSTKQFSYVRSGDGEIVFQSEDSEGMPKIKSAKEAATLIGSILSGEGAYKNDEDWAGKVLYAFNSIQNSIISSRPEEERAVDTHSEVIEMMLVNLLTLKHISPADSDDSKIWDERFATIEEMFAVPLVQALAFQDTQVKMGKISKKQYDEPFIKAYVDFYNLGVMEQDAFKAEYDHYRKEKISQKDIKAFLKVVSNAKAINKNAKETLSLFVNGFSMVDTAVDGISKPAVNKAKNKVEELYKQAAKTSFAVLNHPITLAKASQLLSSEKAPADAIKSIERQLPKSITKSQEYELTHKILAETLDKIAAAPADEWYYKAEEPALQEITQGKTKAEALSETKLSKKDAEDLSYHKTNEFVKEKFDEATK